MAIRRILGDLVHDSGQFYSIKGLRVEGWPQDPGVWEQPIIHQNEIGLLGFIAAKLDGLLHLLVQARSNGEYQSSADFADDSGNSQQS